MMKVINLRSISVKKLFIWRTQNGENVLPLAKTKIVILLFVTFPSFIFACFLQETVLVE